MDLTFNDVLFDVIDRNNQPWVRSPQIGEALGYTKGSISISKLYEAHADEFTDAMTAVVTLPTEGGPQETRIFSLRGCHLLAMFARTPVAKAFRKWVLDVLDMLAASDRPAPQTVSSDTLSPSHRAELKAIVDAKLSTYPAELQGKARAELWTRFNRHFKIAEYAQLPAARMAEARDYLIEVQMRTYPKQAEEPKRLESDLETHCIALRTLSRQMNEHIAEIYSIVRHAIPPRNAPSERRSLALLSMNGMEDASSAVGCNLNAIESSARAVLLASRA